MKRFFILFLLAVFLTSACGVPAAREEKLSALASTTFLADIARNVAGDRLMVDSILPTGVDPHSYQPSPQDIAKIENSRLLIINGAGYEHFLDALLESQRVEKNIVVASAHISLREDAAGVDPHIWLDPNLVLMYVENIRAALTEYDPAGAAAYQANAEAYSAQLQELDLWIQAQANQIPEDKRLLVTNHEALGYFAARYGFQTMGSVIPSFSSNASPSAQQMARLIDSIRETGVPAIFLDAADQDALAQQIADETGVAVISDLYLESLTQGPPAGTYLDMMKHNAARIVEALK